MDANQLPDDLNPEIVKATATFIGKITGMVPPPHDAFPPEWYGYLRTFTGRLYEIARENTTAPSDAAPIQLSVDVLEYLREGINNATQCEDGDVDYEFARGLEQLLHPIYTAPVAPQADGDAAPVAWMPIASAPRDGSTILLRFGIDGTSQGRYVYSHDRPQHPWEFIDDQGAAWIVNHAVDALGGPSHWMPIANAAPVAPAVAAPNDTWELIREINGGGAAAIAASFQLRVQPWLMECFGAEIAADRIERNHRFFEEAIELIQACGMTASEAHQLVDYTFGRPLGEPSQEVGGVMVTLAALCLANGLDMHVAGETELARISFPDVVTKIRAKQAAKPKHSPLPEATAQPNARAACEYCRGTAAVLHDGKGDCGCDRAGAPQVGATLTDERILGEFTRCRVHVYGEDGEVKPLGNAVLQAARALLADQQRIGGAA